MALTLQVKATVSLDNLATQHKELNRLSQIRLSYLDDIAHVAEDYVLSLVKDGLLLYDALLKLSERCREESEIYVSAVRGVSPDDQYVFCKLLSERLLRSTSSFALSLLLKENTGNKVAFVRSRKAEEILDLLKDKVSAETFISVNDFKEAIGCTVSGEADYCLLPCTDHTHLPIAGLLDTVLNTDLQLSLYIQTENASFGLYGKERLNQTDLLTMLQFAFPQEKSNVDMVELPIPKYLIERFAYTQGEERSFRLDTFLIPNKDDVYAVLLFYKIFYPTVKLFGCASFAQL